MFDSGLPRLPPDAGSNSDTDEHSSDSETRSVVLFKYEATQISSVDRRPTKVVVRRLPYDMTLRRFVDCVSPLPDYDYLSFKTGKYSNKGALYHKLSQAYINFRNYEDIFDFNKKYDGYLFQDLRGRKYPAIVEFAPFQVIPKITNANEKNKSIVSEPEYDTFVRQVNSRSSKEPAKNDISILENYERAAPVEMKPTPLIEYYNSLVEKRLQLKNSKLKKGEQLKKPKEVLQNTRKDDAEKLISVKSKKTSGKDKSMSRADRSKIRLEELANELDKGKYSKDNNGYPANELGKHEYSKDEVPNDCYPANELGKDEYSKDEVPNNSFLTNKLDKGECSKDDVPKNSFLAIYKGGYFKDEVANDCYQANNLDKGEYSKYEVSNDCYPANELARGECPKDEVPNNSYPAKELGKDEYSKDDVPNNGFLANKIDHGEYSRDEVPNGGYPVNELDQIVYSKDNHNDDCLPNKLVKGGYSKDKLRKHPADKVNKIRYSKNKDPNDEYLADKLDRCGYSQDNVHKGGHPKNKANDQYGHSKAEYYGCGYPRNLNDRGGGSGRKWDSGYSEHEINIIDNSECKYKDSGRSGSNNQTSSHYRSSRIFVPSNGGPHPRGNRGRYFEGYFRGNGSENVEVNNGYSGDISKRDGHSKSNRGGFSGRNRGGYSRVDKGCKSGSDREDYSRVDRGGKSGSSRKGYSSVDRGRNAGSNREGYFEDMCEGGSYPRKNSRGFSGVNKGGYSGNGVGGSSGCIGRNFSRCSQPEDIRGRNSRGNGNGKFGENGSSRFEGNDSGCFAGNENGQSIGNAGSQSRGNRGGYSRNRANYSESNRDSYSGSRAGYSEGNKGGYSGSTAGYSEGVRDSYSKGNRGGYSEGNRGGYSGSRAGYSEGNRGGYSEGNRGGYSGSRAGYSEGNKVGYSKSRASYCEGNRRDFSNSKNARSENKYNSERIYFGRNFNKDAYSARNNYQYNNNAKRGYSEGKYNKDGYPGRNHDENNNDDLGGKYNKDGFSKGNNDDNDKDGNSFFGRKCNKDDYRGGNDDDNNYNDDLGGKYNKDGFSKGNNDDNDKDGKSFFGRKCNKDDYRGGNDDDNNYNDRRINFRRKCNKDKGSYCGGNNDDSAYYSECEYNKCGSIRERYSFGRDGKNNDGEREIIWSFRTRNGKRVRSNSVFENFTSLVENQNPDVQNRDVVVENRDTVVGNFASVVRNRNSVDGRSDSACDSVSENCALSGDIANLTVLSEEYLIGRRFLNKVNESKIKSSEDSNSVSDPRNALQSYESKDHLTRRFGETEALKSSGGKSDGEKDEDSNHDDRGAEDRHGGEEST